MVLGTLAMIQETVVTLARSSPSPSESRLAKAHRDPHGLLYFVKTCANLPWGVGCATMGARRDDKIFSGITEQERLR